MKYLYMRLNKGFYVFEYLTEEEKERFNSLKGIGFSYGKWVQVHTINGEDI